MVIELTLHRNTFTKESTIGSLSMNKDNVDTFLCYTLEDCVREIPDKPVSEWKVTHETAIPIGRYRVLKTFSNRFQRDTLQLMDVPGFEGIRIHAGNSAKDTEGCILCGSATGENVITHSRDALEKVESILFSLLLNKADVFITVA